MKILLLMRHGKSSWKDSKHGEDKRRPLNKKGEKDAQKMMELVKEKDLFPQVILTSTALRARNTANVFLDHCDGEIHFIALDNLYMAEPPVIREVLRSVPDQMESVLVIGHNPGMECLLQELTGAVESLSPGSMAYLELPVEHWSALSSETQIEKWEKWRPKDA